VYIGFRYGLVRDFEEDSGEFESALSLVLGFNQWEQKISDNVSAGLAFRASVGFVSEMEGLRLVSGYGDPVLDGFFDRSDTGKFELRNLISIGAPYLVAGWDF
jgi:hypothetical protein